jgi:hypothetical protein
MYMRCQTAGAGRRFPTPDRTAIHLSRSNEQLLVSRPTVFALVCIALAFWDSLDIQPTFHVITASEWRTRFSFHRRLFDSSE